MNEMQVFKNSEFGEIGVLTIEGREYFPATACAKMLGYADPYDAIKRHARGSVKHLVPTYNQHGAEVMQERKFIPESDLYRLITHSKLPAAEKFERWIFEEVLPTIRKQGYYSTRNELPMDKVMEIVQLTMTATITEFVRQLIPAITPMPQVQTIQSQPTFTFTMANPQPQPTPIKRQRRRSAGMQGKIEKLSPELRNQVDNMLFSRKYTYKEISDWLKALGHDISYGAVGRYVQYYNELFN